MDYSISCNCGRSLLVSEGLAGASATCECGERVRIPSLKGLRSSVGLDPIPITPEDQIAGMLRNGELPGDKCLCCGHLAERDLEFEARCESKHQRGLDPDGWLYAFLRPGLFRIVASNGSSRYQVMGRETVVPVVLAVCDSCQSRLPLGNGRAAGAVTVLSLLAALPAFWIDSRLGLTLVGVAVIGQLLAGHGRTTFQSSVRRLASTISAYQELFRKFPHALIVRSRQATSVK